MYGNALQQGEDPRVQPPANSETLANINDETLKCLINSNDLAEAVVRKINGPRPESKGNEIAHMPDRSVFGDAKEMRNLAFVLFEKLNRLSSFLS